MKKGLVVALVGTLFLYTSVHAAGLVKTPLGIMFFFAGAVCGKKALNEYEKTEKKEAGEQHKDIEKKFANDMVVVLTEIVRTGEFCTVKKDELQKSWQNMKEKYGATAFYGTSAAVLLSVGLKLVRK